MAELHVIDAVRVVLLGSARLADGGRGAFLGIRRLPFLSWHFPSWRIVDPFLVKPNLGMMLIKAQLPSKLLFQRRKQALVISTEMLF